MSVDPHAPRRVSATIKFPESARYANDNPWLVFEGDSAASVKQQVVEAFGFEDTENLLLHEVVGEAQSLVSATGNARTGLGGKPTGNGGWGSGGRKAEGKKSEPEKTPEELERERLTGEIEKATTRDELKQLWARNQKAFEDEGLMNTWKAKGKTLPA